LDKAADAYIENRTFDELSLGETASSSHTVTQRDIDLFATVTGDVNPAHVDPVYAETDMFHHIIIQGMWGAGLISAVLGTKLPGPGTIYLGQDLRFRRPVSIGDTITATVTVREKKPEKGDVTLDCVVCQQHGESVIHRDRLHAGAKREGSAQACHAAVCAGWPSRWLRPPSWPAPLVAPPVATAVVHPVDTASLLAALDAARAGLIVPILIGPAARMQEGRHGGGADIAALRLIDAPDAALPRPKR